MKGKIVQVIGPVLDVEFPEGKLPKINEALKVSGEYDSGDTKVKVNLTLEVAAHVGDNTVRAFALGAGCYCPMQRAIFLSTESVVILVHVTQDVVEAPATATSSALQPVIRSADLLQYVILRLVSHT